MTNSSVAQAQTSSPTTTGVMVILTVKAGVAREQVMAVMPAEIRATVPLYLNGRIREWYSRGDGRGVVFLLDARDVSEAQTIMEGLPLGKENFMDHEYIAISHEQAERQEWTDRDELYWRVRRRFETTLPREAASNHGVSR
jgi:hypothetical protein